MSKLTQLAMARKAAAEAGAREATVTSSTAGLARLAINQANISAPQGVTSPANSQEAQSAIAVGGSKLFQKIAASRSKSAHQKGAVSGGDPGTSSSVGLGGVHETSSPMEVEQHQPVIGSSLFTSTHEPLRKSSLSHTTPNSGKSNSSPSTFFSLLARRPQDELSSSAGDVIRMSKSAWMRRGGDDGAGAGTGSGTGFDPFSKPSPDDVVLQKREGTKLGALGVGSVTKRQKQDVKV